jgi:hypothetical protein
VSEVSREGWLTRPVSALSAAEGFSSQLSPGQERGGGQEGARRAQRQSYTPGGLMMAACGMRCAACVWKSSAAQICLDAAGLLVLELAILGTTWNLYIYSRVMSE